MDDVAKLDHLSMADRLAMFTEYNLATLEALEDVKSSPKYSIRRQRSICDQMVRACAAFGATGPNWFGGPACSRLADRLSALQPQGQPAALSPETER